MQYIYREGNTPLMHTKNLVEAITLGERNYSCLKNSILSDSYILLLDYFQYFKSWKEQCNQLSVSMAAAPVDLANSG